MLDKKREKKALRLKAITLHFPDGLDMFCGLSKVHSIKMDWGLILHVY